MPRARLLVIEAPVLELPGELRALSVASAIQPPEGPDREGIEHALSGVEQLIERSPRLRAVRSTADRPLDPVEVCAADGTDAVILLEGFRSEGAGEVRHQERVVVGEDGTPEVIDTYTAWRDSRVFTSWRLVDREGQQLDLLQDVFTVARWAAEEDSDTSAQEALPSAAEAIAELGRSSGIAYGKRIAPVVGTELRTYFVRGDRRLAWARLPVRVGDWQTAGALWREVAGDPSASDEIRGRALANLALMHEVLGDYALALRRVALSLATHDSARIRRYREVLRERWAQQRELRRTLTPEEISSP
ncbi:MAG TPA: hypothetical protein ENK18_05770 [Deltaproteobacteria bacterium]|nr:hypothetical protein [Deltaproteobacteria bacterium]